MAAFESLSNRLQNVFRKLRGKGKVSEEDVNEAMREVRLALLEADVNFKVVKTFIDSVKDATGEQAFTYVTAVTHLKGSPKAWEQHPTFVAAMKGNPIKVVTLKEMLHEVSRALSKTMAGTEFGRTLQLFKAAGIEL